MSDERRETALAFLVAGLFTLLCLAYLSPWLRAILDAFR